jgi:hypothetical protein
MRLLRHLSVFGACAGAWLAACGRPPSSVPLGGKEWVAEERHVDRRPHGEEVPADITPKTRPVAEATTRAATAEPAHVAAPTTVAVETQFGRVPLPQGALVTLRTKYTVRATLVTSLEEGGSTQSIEADAAEKIAVRVVRGGDDGPREVDVEYLESTGSFRMDGMPNDDDSNTGKRFNVVFEGSEPRVSKRAGALEPDEDRSVLFDLATVTGYFPLLAPRLPRALGPGFRLRLESRDLSRMFGARDDVDFEGGEIALRGRSASDGKIAVFDCQLPAKFEKDGVQLRVDLKGTLNVRAADARPLDVSLNGTIRADASALGAGASLNGTVVVELSHEYK